MDDAIKDFVDKVWPTQTGHKIWKIAHEAMVDDTDNNMVDVANTKHNGSSTELAFMKPFKKLDLNAFDEYGQKVIAVAAMADLGNTVDQIRLTGDCPAGAPIPAYHFFNQGTVNRFYERLRRIIEAAAI